MMENRTSNLINIIDNFDLIEKSKLITISDIGRYSSENLNINGRRKERHRKGKIERLDQTKLFSVPKKGNVISREGEGGRGAKDGG